ncbi:cellulose synthase-like protein E1 isoform X2 [Quercus robur]|uniref:cellulose synthase-like protein E1 isoform X2 n=1 Tax=Quercus robur TaxID=38942 RepID=UPI002161DB34|nr:cellulose synthase-like protein E1 isoform X2 [Quercus robur]
MGRDGYLPLFETRRAKGRVLYRLFMISVFVGICLIWIYRVSHIPRKGEDGRWGWIGLLGAEFWFGLYWVLTQAHRWNQVYRCTFKDRLSQRHEKELPKVDIFVCTADPVIEPPVMVINTVLSVMAYDYPQEKLSVYLSDDGGSDLTFYALLEASHFAKHWLPYCKKFKVEPRSPAEYFNSSDDPLDANQSKELVFIKKLYDEMENRIKNAAKLARIPEELRSKHTGFSQWDSYSSQRDHDTILQILIDGRDPNAKDKDGFVLPTLVYLAREKRPQHHHNFKAGAMNALIRVSSEISNGPIILNVDCDMYSNNSHSVQDALCFFMDEEKGHEIAFVQFPQSFKNVTRNEIYDASMRVIREVEFHGLDGCGGPLYVGTGCFHRRDTLCGRKFSKEYKTDWSSLNDIRRKDSVHELEKNLKGLASSTYDKNTQWGKEMGLLYGCPVEDVITGLSIQCRGWKSVYFNPSRTAFLGIAATTLPDALLQHKRWSEGDLQILFSRYSPAWYAHGKISLALQMGYCVYCLWAPNCLATLYYTVIPSLYLLKGISLFPQISSPWFIPFAYVISAKNICALAEFLWCGGTIIGWWNNQRMWLYKRTSSYLFAFMDTILKLLGFAESGFVISTKIADQDVSQRYEKEIMEFGTSTPMFTILSTLAMINLVCFVGVLKEALMGKGIIRVYETMSLQFVLCGILVLINFPLYQALFLRKDKGKLPSSLAGKSIVLALLACISFTLLY